jgi:hypothetical protein
MRVVLYIVLAVNAAYLYLNVEHWRAPAASGSNTFAYVKQLVLISEAAADELRLRHEPAPLAQPTVTSGGDSAAGQHSQSESTHAKATVGETETTLASVALKLTCYSVGPITDDSEQKAVATWLGEQGAHAQLREGERRELARYWVHLAPLGSLGAAKAQLLALRDAGIDDLHVIRRGNMANAISLGLYSRKTHLERRIASLETAGVKPQVQERYRTYKSSWFDVVTAADSLFSDEALAERFPAVESRTRACGNSGEQADATG